MRQWTWAEIKQKLNDDLDIEDEDFIDENELLGYVNEAIDDAEANIHKLGLEDRYFLAYDTVALVTNTSLYDMPDDIYANKIVALLYNDTGTIQYELMRIKRLVDTLDVGSNDDYRYMIVNINDEEDSAPKIKLYPASRETSAYITRWYIRNARQLTATGDETCDIPEFINYVLQHTKKRVYEKDGDPRMSQAIMDTKEQRDLMIQTLENMVDDEQNTIDPDLSFYADFDSYDRFY